MFKEMDEYIDKNANEIVFMIFVFIFCFMFICMTKCLNTPKNKYRRRKKNSMDLIPV